MRECPTSKNSNQADEGPRPQLFLVMRWSRMKTLVVLICISGPESLISGHTPWFSFPGVGPCLQSS